MQLEVIDAQFRQLHLDATRLLATIPPDQLYRDRDAAPSCGECLVRSAGAVERTFGGLTANLWDDPFEWTLPETLKTPADVLTYLNEVETTRLRGFSLLKDGDLDRLIAVAPDELKLLSHLLRETLENATTWQTQAARACA
jgi:hypothetical protein